MTETSNSSRFFEFLKYLLNFIIPLTNNIPLERINGRRRIEILVIYKPKIPHEGHRGITCSIS